MLMKTEQELRQLALDVVEGKVFTDRHCRDQHEVSRAFMILNLMDKAQMDELLAKKPAMFYEYLDKAGPLAVNGNPTFFSLAFLTDDEFNIYAPLVKKLIDQRQEFLGEQNAK